MLLPAPVVSRAGQLALLVILVLSTRRRMRWVRTAIFFTAVVGFNLATPGGRVVVELLGFPVTDGALRAGLTKALALTSLLLLSKLSVRRDLLLPGRLGALLSLTLAYVRYLLDADLKLLARDPMGRLDSLLRHAQHSVGAAPPVPASTASTAAGITILTALLGLNWAVVIVGS